MLSELQLVCNTQYQAITIMGCPIKANQLGDHYVRHCSSTSTPALEWILSMHTPLKKKKLKTSDQMKQNSRVPVGIHIITQKHLLEMSKTGGHLPTNLMVLLRNHNILELNTVKNTIIIHIIQNEYGYTPLCFQLLFGSHNKLSFCFPSQYLKVCWELCEKLDGSQGTLQLERDLSGIGQLCRGKILLFSL